MNDATKHSGPVDVLAQFDPVTASMRGRTACSAMKFCVDVLKLRELVGTDSVALRNAYTSHLIGAETSIAQMADRLMRIQA